MKSEQIEAVKALLDKCNVIIRTNDANEESMRATCKQLVTINEFIRQKGSNIALLKSAANLLSQVMDQGLANAVSFITEVINDALRKVFPRDIKKIKLELSPYNASHPQLNLVLMTKQGLRRLKTQEGTGLKQIISVLYIMCLIFLGGGRKFVFLDEVLDGLHEDAMEIMDTLLDIFVSDLGFQIMLAEHGYPVGENTNPYYIIKTENGSVFVEADVYYAHKANDESYGRADAVQLEEVG